MVKKTWMVGRPGNEAQGGCVIGTGEEKHVCKGRKEERGGEGKESENMCMCTRRRYKQGA